MCSEGTQCLPNLQHTIESNVSFDLTLFVVLTLWKKVQSRRLPFWSE